MKFAVELTPGSQVWFDGEVWTITEFGRGTVTLSSGQSVRTVSIPTLATSASPMTESSATPKDRELVPIVLEMLDSRTLAELERRAEHVRAVLDAPCSRVGDRTRAIERKAKELNISAKTLRRWIAAYAEAGVAGLADSRITRKHPPSVDPRWDAACARILRDFTNASTPTRGAVIDATARAVESEYGEGIVPVYDPQDRGLRDMWEITVTTGRRIGEVLQVRWDCLRRYGGLPTFWHDQTKVGNYDAAIRIPERLHDVIAERKRKTLERFFAQHGQRPVGDEHAGLALFPTSHRNHDGTVALTYQWFHSRFRDWIAELDLGHCVPHQARHTLATNLLRAGASLTHIRRYLGQISDRMAEHYVHLSNSDLEDVLQQVWVARPGAANPGELLNGTVSPMTREQAQALAIDLSRRSTPAEGGFCTFQPVVDGGACPWNLDCHNCDKFVLSGADLLYWRRKREQWRQLAEGAPDDATAEYLHRYFEPTARAIDGLERALAGLGLLDQALALDLRKPQDYFRRVWSTAFHATDLANTAGTAPDENSEITDDEQEACA